MYMCPECGKKIDKVITISDCTQKCTIDETGNIIDWGSVEEILETTSIRCSNCLEPLKELEDNTLIV